MTINIALATALKHADPSIAVPIKLAGTNGSSLQTLSRSLPNFTAHVQMLNQTHSIIGCGVQTRINSYQLYMLILQDELIHMLYYHTST